MGTRRGSAEEDQSLCPICDELHPVSKIQAHCEAHFAEEGGPPPQRVPELLERHSGQHPDMRGGDSGGAGQMQSGQRTPPSVRAEQIKPANTRRSGDDLIPLIVRCLESQGSSFTAAVTGSVDHYQSEPSDAGWGCGYRNIQMLVSNLLKRESLEKVLFDGCGFVPDIPSLQALVEAAWAQGWDTAGKDQLGGKLQGTRSWIGTTECAALLRSFGINAKIVDFEGGRGHVLLREAEALGDSKARGEDAGEADPGATRSDEVHPGVQCDGCDQFPITGARPCCSVSAGGPCYTSRVQQDYDLCSRCHQQPQAERAAPFARRQGRTRGQEDNGPALVKWVWKHFTGEDPTDQSSDDTGRQGHIIQSDKPPLYFQHEGHSRTIVGVEHRRSQDGELWALLILDPNEHTQALREALQSGRGWQRKLKRGTHTLRKAEYQVLYVEDQLMSEAEQEDSKIIRADERF